MIELKEAFREGQASIVIHKLVKILERRLHKKLLLVEIPFKYVNIYGKFAGYYVGIKNTKRVIRINFQLTSSDSIVSVDFYVDKKRVAKGIPTFTIDTVDENSASLNIVQIIDFVSAELDDFDAGMDDNHEQYQTESVLKERMNQESRYQFLFDEWLKDHPEGVTDLTTKRIADVYADFLTSDQQYNSEVNLANFVKMSKQYLFSKGLTNPTFRKKKKGSKERVIADQAKSDELEDIVDNMGWEEKFSHLTSAVKGIAANMIQALVLWGSPGSGKSRTVYDVLDSEKVDYHKFTGGLKNGDELFKLLSKYSKNELIVFDDFDSVFKNLDMVNLLKSATENKPKREITWRDKILEFTSGIIFISNLTKFDSALFSRAMRIQIDLNNEQMLDKIQKTMSSFHPEIPMTTKKIALEFLKEVQGGVASIDYREFEKTMIAITLEPKNWKSFALLMIKSGN